MMNLHPTIRRQSGSSKCRRQKAWWRCVERITSSRATWTRYKQLSSSLYTNCPILPHTPRRKLSPIWAVSQMDRVSTHDTQIITEPSAGKPPSFTLRGSVRKLHFTVKNCGEWRSECLQFHHRDPKQKEFNVGESIRNGVSLEKLKSEIAKCDVLCANCHAIETQNERYRRKGIHF